MIFPWNNVKPFGFHDWVFFVDGVINGYLICAFSNLSLSVKHEASSEWVNFTIIRTRSVTLSSLDLLNTVVLDILPFGLSVFDIVAHETSQIELCYLSVGIEVETSKQICPIVNTSQSCTFPWSRLPVENWHFYNGYIKAFPLLHSLNVGLETPCQFFNELVSGDIISWLSDEKFRSFIILVTWRLNYFDVVLGPIAIQFSLIESLNSLFEGMFWIHMWSLAFLRRDGTLVIVIDSSLCLTVILNWREPQTLWIISAEIGRLRHEFVVRFCWVELVTSKNDILIWVGLSLLHWWNAIIQQLLGNATGPMSSKMCLSIFSRWA